MSPELEATDTMWAEEASGSAGPARAHGADRRRPDAAGDLATLFRAEPMFARAVAGYDRFQVDGYVRWAEDELAAADRERERLLARHLRTLASLEEAEQLLAHSPAGGELLQLSRPIGSLLAAAADEASTIRAQARAALDAATASAEQVLARAERVLADAGAQAQRVLAQASAEAAEAATEAGRVLADAEATRARARAAVEARLAEVGALAQRAAADAEDTRRRAAAEAATALLQARDEVVRRLGAGRDQRRRADDVAAATRDRLDRQAADRRAALLADVAGLERRRAALRAEVQELSVRLAAQVSAPVGAPAAPRVGLFLRRHLERFGRRPGTLRTR
jgi:cell division septum initiation protein DivIVA